MKSLDEGKHTESNDFKDIMYRRMKNRERQRRYRERKRLAAETKSPCVITSEPIPLPVQPQLNGNLNSCVARVHRRRDWKKDARRAHAAAANAQTLTSQSQIPSLCYGAIVESSVEREVRSDNSLGVVNIETKKTIPGRRDWKAAARNKKSGNG